MDVHKNFVDYFQIDVAFTILAFLDDPTDLIRASAVSRSWRHFVIANCLCKKLCLRKFPPVSSIDRVIEENDGTIEPANVVSRLSVTWETQERTHRIYSSLLGALTKPMNGPKECIAFVVSASSTDREPYESVVNTLMPLDSYGWGWSYWSSRGHTDPNVPEYILFKLNSDMCIATEIYIRPFKVVWEPGSPIYSAKSVRFRTGHPKVIVNLDVNIHSITVHGRSVEDYVWTYTSPEFPMRQESCLQQFKLPEPALCIGGYLLIELLGRAQREAIDGLFYICVGHVKVLGQSLKPGFDIEMQKSGEVWLKYCPKAVESDAQNSS